MNTQHNFDLYQHVTNKIIEALEQGTAPWIKPWKGTEQAFKLPINAFSNRSYSGINILLLWLSMEENGYSQHKWITAKGANLLGGNIRKGEKATIVVMYQPIEREKIDDDGEVILDQNGDPEMERFAILKKHHVFNIEQCENLPNNLYETVSESETKSESDKYKVFGSIRQIIKGMGVNVKIKPSNQAFYQIRDDMIVMPEMKQFDTEENFYSTLLHEMTHATGHQSRLARKSITSGQAKFGNATYAFEELVAEMGSAFLCASLGFNTIPQNASYIASWIEVLRKDKRAIFKASGKAREAYEYMHDTLNIVQPYNEYHVSY